MMTTAELMTSKREPSRTAAMPSGIEIGRSSSVVHSPSVTDTGIFEITRSVTRVLLWKLSPRSKTA